MKLLLKNIKGNCNKEEKLEEDNLINFKEISYKSQPINLEAKEIK